MSKKGKQSQVPMPSLVGYIWRPVKRVDAVAMHKMLQAVDAADDSESAGLLEDLERNFEDTWADPESDSVMALIPEDGTVADLIR